MRTTAYCKKCGKEMEETEIDDRSEFAYITYHCEDCTRTITEKVYKPEITI